MLDFFGHGQHDFGPGMSLLYAVHRLLQLVSAGRVRFVPYALMAQPVRPTLGQVPFGGRGTEVQRVQPGHPWLEGLPREAAVVAGRFEAGAECFVARHRGKFAGCIWTARRKYLEDEVRCDFELTDPQSTIWDFDVYVEPRYRMTRVLATLWLHVNAALHEEGIHWTLSRISQFNTASMRAHQRLGAQRVATAIFLVVGPVEISWCGTPARMHVSLSKRKRIGIRVAPPSEPLRGAIGPSALPSASRRTAALVLGVDSHGLAVIRALADAGVPTYALERDMALPGALTNRLQGLFPTAGFEAEHLIPALRKARQQLAHFDQVSLLAINDRQVEAIGHHIAEVSSLFAVSWADCADAVLELQRKSALQKVSERQGLRYPRSVLFDGVTGVERVRDFRFPMIIKPVRPLSSFKTLLAGGPEELAKLLHERRADLPILGQEYVAGDDTHIHFGALLLDRGHVVHGMTGRKLASHPPARGQTIVAETTQDEEILALTRKFFDGCNLSGPVSLELKRDAEGACWVIEPTVGRTDFWAELCISAGFNQPLLEHQVACGLPVSPAAPMRHCMWYDTERAPLAYLLQSVSRLTWRPGARSQVFPYVGHRDPGPAGRAMRNLVARAVGRVRARTGLT